MLGFKVLYWLNYNKIRIYLLCMCYLFFLFVTKSLHRHKVTLFCFSFIFARMVIFLDRHLFFLQNWELYDLQSFHSLTEHQQFPLSRSKVGQLVDWLFSQLSESLRNTDKELWPVGKLSFTVSISRKDKNLLYCTSDPAS